MTNKLDTRYLKDEIHMSILGAFRLLDRYCKKVDYVGWDVFDGLNSKVFRKSPFYRSAFFRLAWIQFFKRSPSDFRKLCLVPKGANPKGLALFASGLVMQKRLKEARTVLKYLMDMATNYDRNVSWGYNFPWQARAFYVPKGTPNMVTTVFVSNALLDYYEATNETDYLETAIAAGKFILENLILFEAENVLCFGYIPGKEAKVHNANMLGAAMLARIYRHTDNWEFLEKSRKAIAYSMEALTSDYYWPYGELGHHGFVDNFHTGFNLVALKDWIKNTKDRCWEELLRKAYQQFIDSFWLKNGCPKYYNNKLYPIDIHCSAQGIVTCLKLKKYDDRSLRVAKNIANWATQNMQDPKGFFYYQKTKLFLNKIPYIRWSQAWMYFALSLYLSKMGGNHVAGK